MRMMKTLPRRMTALGLALTMTFSAAWAAAGEQRLQTTTELVEGLTYRNTVTENGGSRVESYSFELSPNSAASAILLQGDETIYGGGSITQAVAGAQARGYHVLGAVNTDFFSVTTGVPMGIVIEDGVYKSSNYLENAMVIGPNGISLIEDPTVSLTLYNQTNGSTVVPRHLNKARNSVGGTYLLNGDFSTVSTRSSGAGWYVRMKIGGEELLIPKESESPVTEPPAETGVEPTESPAAQEGEQPPEGSPVLPVEETTSPEGSPIPSAEETALPEENGEPGADSDQEAVPVQTEEPDPSKEPDPSEAPDPSEVPGPSEEPGPSEDPDKKLKVNGTLELVVTEVLRSDQPMPMGKDEYILTAADESELGWVFDTFQVGDRITLTTTCDDPVLSTAQWACGVGDIMVKDGVMTDPANWTYMKDGRQPRTAMGLKPDGTLVFYAVDGRRAGHSAGLTQMDLTTELQRQGCTWVANLDGGGSTALSAWIPGQGAVAIQSRPSDGTPRRCATYLLLVTAAGDGTADRLALAQEGQVLLTGTSLVLPQTVAVDTGLSPVSTDLTGLSVTSQTGLGTVSEGVYTAGPQGGTDTLLLQAGELTGTAQLHLVDHLTQMQVGRTGTEGTLASLRVFTGARVDLSISGSYWGREALRGFGAETWTVEGDVGTVDPTGRFVAAMRPTEGTITCTVGGLSQTILVTVVDRHEDIQPDHWAYAAVDYCYEKGIVGGVSLTKFGRDNPIRRGDFIQMLYNAMGRPPIEEGTSFLDVEPSAYYYQAISWAQAMGLATGVGDGNFAPGDPLTREQAFTLLYRFLASQGVPLTDGEAAALETFTDGGQVADYAKIPAATLVGVGLVGGSGDRLNPQNTLSRAEMAMLLYRVMEFAPDLGAALDHEPGIPGAVDAPEPEPPKPPEKPEEPEVPVVHTGRVIGISSYLRVRSGPGPEHEVIGQLLEGDTVEILEEIEGWYMIRYPVDGDSRGYVSAEYVIEIENTEHTEKPAG